MGLKSNEIDPLLIRQLKQTANKPVTRLVLLTGFNTPPAPSQEGSQLQPVTKSIAQLFLYSPYCTYLFIMQRLRRFHLYRLVHREPDAEADHTRHQQIGSSEGDRETPPGIGETIGVGHIEVKHI